MREKLSVAPKIVAEEDGDSLRANPIKTSFHKTVTGPKEQRDTKNMPTEKALKIARILDNAHSFGTLEDPKCSMRNIQLIAIHFADEIKEAGGTKEVVKHAEIADSLYAKLDDGIRLKDFVQLTEEGHKVIREALLDS